MAGDSWITWNRWNFIPSLLRFLGTFPSFYIKNWDNCPTIDQRNFQHVIFNSLNWDKEKIGTKTAWEYQIEIKKLLIIFEVLCGSIKILSNFLHISQRHTQFLFDEYKKYQSYIIKILKIMVIGSVSKQIFQKISSIAIYCDMETLFFIQKILVNIKR